MYNTHCQAPPTTFYGDEYKFDHRAMNKHTNDTQEMTA